MLHFVTSKYTTNKHILFRDNPKSSININWNAKISGVILLASDTTIFQLLYYGSNKELCFVAGG